MIYLLDTNACIVYLNRPISGVQQKLQSLSPQDVAVYSVVKAELFYGAMRSNTFLGKDTPSRACRIVRKDDILFSTVRTYLKNIAPVPDELDGVLTSTGIVESSARTTAGIHKITQKSMEEFILPIPPIDEQQEIFRRVTSLFKLVDIIAQQYQQTKANIKNILELLRSQ